MNKELKEKAKLTEEGSLTIKKIRSNNVEKAIYAFEAGTYSICSIVTGLVGGYGIIETLKGHYGPYGESGNNFGSGICLLVTVMLISKVIEDIKEIKMHNYSNEILEDKIMNM